MANYLVDTQIFIWINQEQYKIPKAIKNVLLNGEHTFYLSIASIWEMQIKSQLEKLTITKTLPFLLKEIRQDNSYQFLPITENHILNLQNLEYFHKDPFDRIIISQAMCEDLTLLTVDEHIIKYPLDFINN